ncbi:MAG: DUF1588 domain-containing protein [Verrucomicrobiales bacterium]|nr:DUF1588 domain-containing protein [Verrucomicrobiales bacterium]
MQRSDANAFSVSNLGPLFIGIALLISTSHAEETEHRGLEFIQRYCVDCHQAPKPKGKLDLQPYAMSVEKLITDALDWDEHLDRVREGDMPPDDDDVLQPSEEERAAFVAWVEGTLRKAASADGFTPGPSMIRRLNRSEYSASIRHLLDIHFDAGEALPDDGAGGEGFDNASETLFISPLHAEKYLEAARTAVEYAFADTRSNETFLIAQPDDRTTPQEAAGKILERFLPRAFRRPVTEEELREYLTLFNAGYQADASFARSIQLVLSAILVSPKFLFIAESPNPRPEPILLTDHELATRLAYFLWGSPPDDELLSLANEHKLHDQETLEAQVIRMLEGKQNSLKVRHSTQNFVEQWLGTRALGREFKPDASIKGYDSELEGGMKYEPVFFLTEILRGNRSLIELIDADYTYANRRLARHYRIKGDFREQPRRVSIENEPHRGGLLGMAAVLTVSSHPNRTSPVLRGKWILENLLGETPPPPPPDVPELEEEGEDNSSRSLRERLEIHRANPTCATCHDRLDPMGFSLENYDVLGRWREEESGHPIDASATLPDGTDFKGPHELKELLLDRKDQIIRQFSKKMLGYALFRGLTYEDYGTVDLLVEDLKEHDYAAHRLILGIVSSVPFRYKAGTDPTIGVQ